MSKIAPAIAFLGIICYIYCVNIKTRRVTDLSLFESLDSKEYSQIFETAKVLEELRKFRHDYKNQLFGLAALLENGEYDRAKEYLSKLTGKIESQIKNKCSFSDNFLIDAVLQKLAFECEKEGITFDATVIAGADFPLCDLDICAVFGNLADNAFEAVMKQNTAKDLRFISFTTSRREKWLIITAENSYDGELAVDDSGAIVTSKADKEHHGIGLNSIKSTVEAAGGSVQISAQDGIFAISLIFPR